MQEITALFEAFNKLFQEYAELYLRWRLDTTKANTQRLQKKLLDIAKHTKVLRKGLMQDGITKFGVHETENLDARLCPKCNHKVEEEGNVKICPMCGSTPFEKADETDDEEV